MADELQKHGEGSTRADLEHASTGLKLKEIGVNTATTQLEAIYKLSGGGFLHFASLERFDDYSAGNSGASLIGVEDDSFANITGDTDLQSTLKSIDNAFSALTFPSATDFILRDGSTPLTGDWDVGGFDVTLNGGATVSDSGNNYPLSIVSAGAIAGISFSDSATGTAPTVESNGDRLDFRTMGQLRGRFDELGNFEVRLGDAQITDGDLTVSDGEITSTLTSGNGSIKMKTDGANSVANITVQNDAQQWLMRVDGTDSDKWKLRNGGTSSPAIEADVSNNVEIPNGDLTVSDGVLSVSEGSSGVVPSGSGDTGFFESSGNVGITLGSPDGNVKQIVLANATGTVARFSHKDSLKELTIGTGIVGGIVNLEADDSVPNLLLSGASGSELAEFEGDVTLKDGDLTVSSGKFRQINGLSGGTASTAYDDIISDSGDSSGMTFLVPSTSNSGIAFGDESAERSGLILYKHTDDSMSFWTNETEQIGIDSSGNLSLGDSQEIQLGDSGDAELTFNATDFQIITNSGDIELIPFGQTVIGSPLSILRLKKTSITDGTTVLDPADRSHVHCANGESTPTANTVGIASGDSYGQILYITTGDDTGIEIDDSVATSADINNGVIITLNVGEGVTLMWTEGEIGNDQWVVV